MHPTLPDSPKHVHRWVPEGIYAIDFVYLRKCGFEEVPKHLHIDALSGAAVGDIDLLMARPNFATDRRGIAVYKQEGRTLQDILGK